MRMLQKKYIGIVLLLLVAVSASAQKAERDYIRKGNRFFKDSVYVDAEVNYRKALEVNPKSTVSMFNLGNTLTQQMCIRDRGNIISIQGFGTFEVKKKAERISVNPTTKQRMLVPPKLVLTYKPSTLLKDKFK